MMIMDYDFELCYADWFTALTFRIPAESHEKAMDKVVGALKSAGAEILRREIHVFEKPILLRARRGK